MKTQKVAVDRAYADRLGSRPLRYRMDRVTDQLLSFDQPGASSLPCSTRKMAIGRPRSLHR